MKGFPLQLVVNTWGKKNWNDRANKPRKKFDDIFSRLDTILHERDRWADRQTKTAYADCHIVEFAP